MQVVDIPQIGRGRCCKRISSSISIPSTSLYWDQIKTSAVDGVVLGHTM